MPKEKVVVGMSGGVDSSAAAYILKEKGYQVLGVTMITGDMPEGVKDAARIAEKLEIPYKALDFKDIFQKQVIQYFIQEYERGRTPNPCVVCNRRVKWEALLEAAKELGAHYIATGHYARIERHPKTNRFALKMSAWENKDQTYALYGLSQEQLKHTLMPVGEYSKDQIREIAQNIDDFVSKKPDSQEICFIPDNDYAGYIEKALGTASKQGDFVNRDGEILGRHQGIIHYTIGQRKGLGISFGKPMFVCHIDKEKNQVVLGDNEDLFFRTVLAEDARLMAFDKIEKGVRVTAKIRYSHKKAPAALKLREDGILECIFDEPQRAVTPGQALVFYDGDFVAGGGTIMGAQQ